MELRHFFTHDYNMAPFVFFTTAKATVMFKN